MHRLVRRCVSSQAAAHLRDIVGAEHALTDPDALRPYNRDWLGINEGKSTLALRPSSTAQISQILTYCSQESIAVVPQSGNTGLVHGSIPLGDEVILSMARMNKIEGFDKIAGVLQCEAGCILQTLHDYVGEHGYMMPYDLGAKGSCMIGGNLSTCAGGINFVRFGRMEGHVLGLEVVLPTGTVVDMMSTMRKDNCGYHLPHLFLGAEGTLGVITKAAVLCHPAPNTRATAFLGCASFDQCLKILDLGRRGLGNDIYAFELIDQATIEIMHRNTSVRTVLSEVHPFQLLIEIGGSDPSAVNDRLTSFLAECLDQGMIQDGAVAADSRQAEAMWALREGTPTEALRSDGHTIKQDISLPPYRKYQVVEETRKRLEGFNQVKAVVAYGHIADGNIHLNITVPRYDQAVYDRLFPWLYEWIVEEGGSISAEHGIGAVKKKYLHLARKPAAIELMRTLKNTLDPKGILNPGKIV